MIVQTDYSGWKGNLCWSQVNFVTTNTVIIDNQYKKLCAWSLYIEDLFSVGPGENVTPLLMQCLKVKVVCSPCSSCPTGTCSSVLQSKHEIRLGTSHGPKIKKIQLGIWLPKPLGLWGEFSLTAQFMQVTGVALAWPLTEVGARSSPSLLDLLLTHCKGAPYQSSPHPKANKSTWPQVLLAGCSQLLLAKGLETAVTQIRARKCLWERPASLLGIFASLPGPLS